MVRIITDSAADFEPAELEQMQIDCIPIEVMFGDQSYRENVDLSKKQFYELLAGEDFPKTSQPSPQALLDLIEEAKEAGDEALYITLSSGISGTYNSACMTRNLADYKGAYVLDSLNATGGQRILVEHAVRLRDAGKSAREILAEVAELRSRVVLYACMDTLEYLYRGGRISQTAYAIGSLAQIKPIIRVEQDGTIGVPEKAMGMRKGMDILCKRLAKQPPCGEFPLYVMYTDNPAPAEKLAEKLRGMGYDVPADHIIGVGAAIGAHVGPNACGIVYVS